MIDINKLRENPEKFRKAVAAKQLDAGIVDKALDLDKKWREVLQEVENLRKEKNEAASVQDIEKGREVKLKLQKKEEDLNELEEKHRNALYGIPNLPLDDVKEGKNETENDVVKKHGDLPRHDFEPKPYWQLGEDLDIIDTQRAAKVSGTRFFYLKGDGVLLDQALVRLGFEVLLEKGFTPVIPPVLIKTESMRGMGYMEQGGDDEMYQLRDDDLILVGTSEQSIGVMHMGETFKGSELPKRYMGYSTCFRREAGSYGKDTKGSFRVHQFNKLEMFSFVKPEAGDREHEFMLAIEEELLAKLKLPYQVVKMCTGDLGFPAARKYDLEGWFPSEGRYRELTSTSTVTDYQARRLNIKYQDKGETKYVHMLNGTVFSQRPILAILENFQQKDGSIVVPEILRKWMGKDKITS